MPDIRPFAGYRYNLDKPEDLGRFVAPPYDMIDTAAVARLYDADPCNVVRIIQNRKEPFDTENRDRHHRAAKLLGAWIDSGVLAKDPAPSLYVYRHEFPVRQGSADVVCRRTSVIALVKLAEYEQGIVLPHEYTLSGPKIDRYELLSATRTHSELIFGLVPDSGPIYNVIAACVQGPAAGTFESEGSVRHTLYRTADPHAIESVTRALAGKKVLIADGHHRYETALSFYRDTGNPAHAWVVMALVSMADPGLVIRPFHRLARTSPGPKLAPLHTVLSQFFDVKDRGEASLPAVNAFLEKGNGADMLLLDTADRRLYGLSLNAAGDDYLTAHPGGMSQLWNRLDVSKINSIVVNKLLGLPLDGTVLHDIFDYVNDADAAYGEAVRSPNSYRGAFFIRPLDIAAVNAIVSGGERMPQKSTNFFPKFFSGLVFNRLENG
ncbi:MAG TPA: DUF1015 domain-containing protein [Chitinivibrionales bacterium]|jgi:uncharacterized protein (DUF1015 family)|nr:DUF1015 domain-containing protein [Chitinivibrionales bacterium]